MIRSIAALIAAVVVGLLIGLTGAFVQAHRMVGNFDGRYLVVPWGAIVAVFVLLMVIRGAAMTLHRKSAGWLVLVGWLAATLFLASETVGGDLAISSGIRQWGYLLGGAVLGSAVATLPPRPFRDIRPEEARSVGTGGPAEGPSGLD